MTSRLDAGDTFPNIALETPDGGSVTAADFRGRKLVVFFYPKDNTPGCTTEAKDFSALRDEFAKAGTAVLGVSKDSAKKHQNFIAKYDLTVDLATDAEEGGLSDTLGIWTEKQNYGRTYMGMVRTTYLIDADGTIARVWNKVRVKDHASQVLEAARAL
ncbi:peroxiredoxin [Qipengyuania oceanensis]|uniref:thioredoxin-dependent peroxiredoxin n=1 Tax=Qipengyuania oceanensis TaxID=1463597 RepID=A0A844YG56_9SPHN|nr:peroxiredoxin [Qipengyuania oceanensis]MXO62922.1 redoxin domain-containing protein [Qipengyuania oceanensis]